MPRTFAMLAFWVIWANWCGAASAQMTLYSPGRQSHYAQVQAQAELVQGLANNQQRNQQVRRAREKGYLDTLHQVDKSAIPVPDDPPIHYPDPDTWQDLTERRVGRTEPPEAHPREASNSPTSQKTGTQGAPQTHEAKRLQDYHAVREICRLILQCPEELARARAGRFLALSERRTWTDYAGRSIEATYLGHGADSSGRTRIWLMKPDGRQYAVNPQVLSSASQQEAAELGQLVSTISTDLMNLRNYLAREVDRQSNLDLQLSAGFNQFPWGNSTFLQVGPPALAIPQPGFVPSFPQGGLQEY